MQIKNSNGTNIRQDGANLADGHSFVLSASGQITDMPFRCRIMVDTGNQGEWAGTFCSFQEVKVRGATREMATGCVEIQ